jgi:hypothetical protein
MPGLLDRPGDKPSLMEEEAVVRLHADKRRAVQDALFCLKTAAHRVRAYKAKDRFVDLLIARQSQDRQLDALLIHNPQWRFEAPEGWPGIADA